MDLDDMLGLAGDIGRYQFLLTALFSVINVLHAFHYFAQTFISIEPTNWCEGSGLECTEPNLNGSMQTCSSGWLYNLTGGFGTVVSEVAIRMFMYLCYVPAYICVCYIPIYTHLNRHMCVYDICI
jgi:hypothetical protein